MNGYWDNIYFTNLGEIQEWIETKGFILITSSRQTIYDKKLKKGLWVMLVKSKDCFYQLNLFGLESGFKEYKSLNKPVETFDLVYADKEVNLYQIKWKKVETTKEFK